MGKNKRICYRDGRRHPVRQQALALPLVARAGNRLCVRELAAGAMAARHQAAYAGYLARLKRPGPRRFTHRFGSARLRLPRYRSPLNQATLSCLWFLYRSSLLAPDLQALLLGNETIRGGTGEISAIALTSPFYLLLEDYFHRLERTGRGPGTHFSGEYLDLIAGYMARLHAAMLVHGDRSGDVRREIRLKLGRNLRSVEHEMLDGLLTVPIWLKGRQGIDKSSALEKFKRPIGRHLAAATAQKQALPDHHAQFEAFMVQAGLRQELEGMLAARALETDDHLRTIREEP
jgi:hypothetical protein